MYTFTTDYNYMVAMPRNYNEYYGAVRPMRHARIYTSNRIFNFYTKNLFCFCFCVFVFLCFCVLVFVFAFLCFFLLF